MNGRPLPLLQLLLAIGASLALTINAQEAAAPPEAPQDPAAVRAQGGGIGGVLVAPTRIVVEGNARAAEVTLLNTGAKPGTYRISFMNLVMGADGNLTEVPAEQAIDPLDSFVRHSPRQVVLEPEVAQTVRLSIRKPSGLAPGEYRSHLLFRAVPDLQSASQEDGESEGLAIRLIPVFGVSIPVIVRHQTTGATVSLSDLALSPATVERGPVLNATLGRAGDESIYGDFIVRLIAAGTETVVGELGGMAIYPPNSSRPVQIPLSLPEGAKLLDGHLELEFRDAEDPAVGRELARASLPLPSSIPKQ